MSKGPICGGAKSPTTTARSLQTAMAAIRKTAWSWQCWQSLRDHAPWRHGGPRYYFKVYANGHETVLHGFTGAHGDRGRRQVQLDSRPGRRNVPYPDVRDGRDRGKNDSVAKKWRESRIAAFSEQQAGRQIGGGQ